MLLYGYVNINFFSFLKIFSIFLKTGRLGQNSDSRFVLSTKKYIENHMLLVPIQFQIFQFYEDLQHFFEDWQGKNSDSSFALGTKQYIENHMSLLPIPTISNFPVFWRPTASFWRLTGSEKSDSWFVFSMKKCIENHMSLVLIRQFEVLQFSEDFQNECFWRLTG